MNFDYIHIILILPIIFTYYSLPDRETTGCPFLVRLDSEIRHQIPE